MVPLPLLENCCPVIFSPVYGPTMLSRFLLLKFGSALGFLITFASSRWPTSTEAAESVYGYLLAAGVVVR